MDDIKKIITILERHKTFQFDDYPNKPLTVEEIIELLKKQDRVLVKDIAEEIIGHKPKVKVGRCPCCGQLLNESSKFCNQCGQAVKWE